MRELVITVPGRPAPKGSLRCVGRGGRAHTLVEDNKNSTPWRKKIADAVRRAEPAPWARGVALVAEATLTLERPGYHYGTGRNAGVLKDRYANAWPAAHGTGDVDKLLRLVLDALQDAGLYPDDAQVVQTIASKAYVAPARTGDVLPWPGAVLRLYAADDVS